MEITINCAFCGAHVEGDKDTFYQTSSDGKQTLKNKYCTVCGEPLIKFCPNCSTGIFIEKNLCEHEPVRVDEGYWKPTPSLLDTHIPKLIKGIDQLFLKKINLTAVKFQSNQSEFITNLGPIREMMRANIDLIDQIITIKKISENIINKGKIQMKSLEKSIDDIKEVQNNVESETKLLDGRLAKKMRKSGLDIMAWEKDVKDFITQCQILRRNQIDTETNSLKPGYNRILNHILYDKTFFKLNCPKCHTQIYSINEKDFFVDSSKKQVKNYNNLSDFFPNGSKTSSSTQSTKNEILLTITLFLTISDEKYNFHAKERLILHNDNEKIIGRDTILDLNYDESEAEDVLFDEQNIFRMVSRSQLKIFKKNEKVYVQGMQYDERRIGTFLNTLENDIRKASPQGADFTSGNTLIIPLTFEKDNQNRIEIQLT